MLAAVGGRLAGEAGGRFYGSAVIGGAMSAISPLFTYFLLTKVFILLWRIVGAELTWVDLGSPPIGEKIRKEIRRSQGLRPVEKKHPCFLAKAILEGGVVFVHNKLPQHALFLNNPKIYIVASYRCYKVSQNNSLRRTEARL